MSASPSEIRYLLDGEEPLDADYDDEADVLYLSRGDGPRPAVSVTTDDGHVVRFDAKTGELVGFTILDWAARWRSAATIEVVLPTLGPAEVEEDEQRHSVLALA